MRRFRARDTTKPYRHRMLHFPSLKQSVIERGGEEPLPPVSTGGKGDYPGPSFWRFKDSRPCVHLFAILFVFPVRILCGHRFASRILIDGLSLLSSFAAFWMLALRLLYGLLCLVLLLS